MSELPEAEPKWLCTDCRTICVEPLSAVNPFDTSDIITGCPRCKQVNSLVGACQAHGCSREAGRGTPNANGYRYFWSCHEHNPRKV